MNLQALRSRPYRRFWLGSIGSTGATQMYFVAMAWLVFKLSGSAFDLGLLGAATALPTIAATLAGGLVADRFNRRNVLIVTNLLAAALLAALALLDATGVVRVWHVLAVAGLLGMVHGFDLPARISIFTALIEPHQMMSAVALNSILWQATRMVLPALGGILIAVGGTAVVFMLCSTGFIVMILVLVALAVPHKTGTRSNTWHDFIDGARFIGQNRLFYLLIALTWIMMFFGTSYVQIMPIFVDIMGSEERGYGILISATGVGSVLGTIIISRFQQSQNLGRIMLGGALLAALSLYGFAANAGFAGNSSYVFIVASGFAVLYSAFSSFYLISSMTILQLKVPDDLRGRVMGIHSITFSLIALGGLSAGSLAAMVSAPFAVAAGATVLLVSTGWMMLRFNTVRQLDGRTL
ncbi:MAG: MFS transporter [Pseudomonadota bacterium]|nr:MFS transporter [Pseudomonadota bacterium]